MNSRPHDVDLTIGDPHTRTVDVDTELAVQRVRIDEDSLKFICPTRMLICGPSESGKSHFILSLIEHRNEVFNQTFASVVLWLPKENLQKYDDYIQAARRLMGSTDFQARGGLPKQSDMSMGRHAGEPRLYIFDDQMLTFFSSPVMADLMVRGSHHDKISVVVVTQDYFGARGPFRHTIMRNFTHQVLFKDLADKTTMRNISIKLVPNEPKFLLDALHWIRKNPVKCGNSRYIIIDSDQKSNLPENLRIRTNIFPTVKGDVFSVNPVFKMLDE